MTELKKEGIQIKVTTASLVGQILSERYEILALVGVGAMGSLYRGRHLSLDRPVAIKVLHADLAEDDTNMERFAREARIAASLQHPHVVHVYDVGNAPDGAPYLVMDFLDGKSLAEIVKDLGPMPLRRALPLIAQIAQGLDYAHSKGLLHRDLKLSNIMVVNEHGHESAKIIDFGIAKLLTESQAQSMTATGQTFGSPLYMSPEQCQGHKLDYRSDVYSLGCVMYEMLTGVPAIKGDSVVSTIYKHLNEVPKRFAEVLPGAKFPGGIEEAVFKALQKNPESRFQSAGEMYDAIAKMVDPNANSHGITAPSVDRSAHKPSVDLVQRSKSTYTTIVVIFFLVTGAVMAYIASNKPAAVTVNAAGEPIVAEYTIDGKKRQFVKDDYNGDDEAPFTWTNPVATTQVPEVIYLQTHQTSNQPRSFDINYEIEGDATVNISDKHHDVILVLSGGAPIKWNIKAAPGVKIEKVILNGWHKQEVTGIASGVPVIEASENMPPNRTARTDNAFEPWTLSSLQAGNDPANDSYMGQARKTISELTGGKDVSLFVQYNQTHKFDI